MGQFELRAHDIYICSSILDISISWLITGKGTLLERKPDASQEEITVFDCYIKMVEATLTAEQKLKDFTSKGNLKSKMKSGR